MHLKQKKNKRGIFYFIIIIFCGIVIWSINFLGNKFYPKLVEYSAIEATKIANVIINKAVSKQLSVGLNEDELFTTTKTNDGLIQSVDFNPVIVNKVLNIITNIIQLNLKRIEEGDTEIFELATEVENYEENKQSKGLIFKLPLGMATNNIFLNNLGPKIPVRMTLIGSVNSNIITKVTNYGINAAVVEVSIKIMVTEKIVLPLVTKDIVIENEIPIAVKMIQGQVPKYYQNGMNQNSSILSIPVE